jgi:Protein of unknown function (DUF4238)
LRPWRWLTVEDSPARVAFNKEFYRAMSTPRDHHFIPAFFLRKWAGANGKLVEYTRKHDKLIARPVGPHSTGYELDLYAFNELPPEVRQYVEQRFFNYADNAAASVLEQHLAGSRGPWPSKELSAWSRFLIGILLRHPDAMPELRAGAQSIWDGSGQAFQVAYKAARKPDDPETFDEFLEKRDPLIAAKMRMNMVIRSFDNEILGEHINGMKWGVVDVSASPVRLLLSDRPVEFSNIKEPEGYILMPINPTKLFVAANSKATFDELRRVQPREMVQRVNTPVVGRARRFVWAQDESQTRFIQNRMSKNLEPTPLFPGVGQYPPIAKAS